MAHSVSEAAARAVKNSERKQAVENRTPEQRVADIRKNRGAKLFVTPDDQDFLLAQYDASQSAVAHLAGASAALLNRAETAEAEARMLRADVAHFEEKLIMLEQTAAQLITREQKTVGDLQAKISELEGKIEEFRSVYQAENQKMVVSITRSMDAEQPQSEG